MKENTKKAIALILTLFVGGFVLISIQTGMVSFGSFPERWLGGPDQNMSYREALEKYEYSFEGEQIEFSEGAIENILRNKPDDFGRESIGKNILRYSTENTGAANSVTGVLWDFRGYDTVGEATVIFIAVAGVAALFRRSKEEDES